MSILNIKPSILITQQQIQNRIQQLAKQINIKFKNKEIIAIGVLKGSFVFYSDLIRLLECTVHCDFCMASSYGNSMSPTSEIKISMDTLLDVTKKHILIIEDIVDRGLTLKFVQSYLKTRSPLSISTVALLAKKQTQCNVDYIGFKLDNPSFIVGYGLDYQECFRNLPYLAEINTLN